MHTQAGPALCLWRCRLLHVLVRAAAGSAACWSFMHTATAAPEHSGVRTIIQVTHHAGATLSLGAVNPTASC